MKQAIFTALLVLVCVTGQAQIKCHIWGELRDTTQGKTVIICPAGTDLRVSNNYITAKAGVQGRFLCNVETDKMTLYNVFLYEQYEHGSLANTEFLVENGATVTLRFDEGKWKVISGGPEQMLKVKMDAEAEKLYLARMNEIDRQREAEHRAYVEEVNAQSKSPEEVLQRIERSKELDAEYETLYFAYRDWENEYYKTHPMLYALHDIANQMRYAARDDIRGREDDRMTPLVSTYRATYEGFHPDDPVHDVIRTHIATWNLKPGKPYIDYQVRNTDGELVPISSLIKGKVTLIDLWASWCGPCRQHSKDMIPIYNKYKDKGFNVVAIAAEQRAEDMLEAMEKDRYPWPSLLELNNENNIWEKNAGGNCMFLIDRDGTILSLSTDATELETLIKKALNIE